MVTFLNFQVLKVWFTNHLIVQLHVVAVLVIYYSCCCNGKTLLDIYLSSFSVSIPHFTGGEPHFSGCYYTLELKPKNSTNSTVCCPMFYEIFWCHLFIYPTIKCSLRNRTTFLNFKIFDFLPELKTFCSFLFWGWKFTTLLHHYKTYFHAPTGNYWWMR